MNETEMLHDPGILIVDDNAEVRTLLQFSFGRTGFHSCCAENGFEALRMLRQRNFRYLVTDYNMPGMDGLELAERARELVPELRIILETGDSTPELRRRAFARGIEAVLAKPFTVQVVVELVSRWLPNMQSAARETLTPPAEGVGQNG